MNQQPDGGWVYEGSAKIDADGSPHAYAPEVSGLPALDYLADAGKPGSWWGIACDDNGEPYIQGTTAPPYDDSSRGFYVSTTSYERPEYAHNDPRRYLNAEEELYIVVPNSFRKSVEGIVMGCKVLATFAGVTVTAIVGDVGPRFGEISVALAKALGIPDSAKTGGVPAGLKLVVYPSVSVPGYPLIPA